MSRWLAPAAPLLVAVALGACSAARPIERPPLPAADHDTLARLAAELEQVDRGLAQSFAAADCGQACLFTGHICALADRICVIAGRHPDDAAAQERCRDARERCRRAHERVAASCRCPAAAPDR